LLLDVVAILDREGVDYVAIGALALAVHGFSRATTDVDALVHASASRLRRLAPAFRSAGFTAEYRGGDSDDPIPGLLQLTDPHGNVVDLIAEFRGLDPLTYDRGFTVSLRDSSLKVASRVDFIALKCFAGSPQDLDDARRVYRAPGPSLDQAILRGATRRLGREATAALEALLAEGPGKRR
jgi:hypothetical protein